MSETTPRPETADAPTDIDESELYQLLADDQRRAAIDVLCLEGALDLAHLAAAVARRVDEDVTPGTVSVRLHHVHLPKLEELGLVAYDGASGTVEPRPALYEVPA